MCRKQSEDQKEGKCTTMDTLGGILLFVCAICLIFGVVAFFVKKPASPETKEVHLTIPTDSLGMFSPADREAIDSLALLVKF